MFQYIDQRLAGTASLLSEDIKAIVPVVSIRVGTSQGCHGASHGRENRKWDITFALFIFVSSILSMSLACSTRPLPYLSPLAPIPVQYSLSAVLF